ncbi:MAG: sulfite exporter TauE/SafE family protein [Actinomycetota bacterium]|nr:sulfite exporter TauE/SafE family protein [Actinomycetota bacterium]
MDVFLLMLGLGLVTSVHCVAMCGTLVATYALKEGSSGRVSQGMTPHLVYQSAKILSYVLVGLILGTLGEVFDLAGVRGWVQLAAGLFMVLLGINMLGRFPLLRKLALRTPRAVTAALVRTRKKALAEEREDSHNLVTPATFGLLTGLMPCGPLQAAQLSAAATGSALSGATAMLGFGLGAAPLMLAFGLGSGYLGSAFKKRMTAVAAIAIIVLGLVMFNRGSMLVGSPLTLRAAKQAVMGSAARTEASPEYRAGADGVIEIDLVIQNTRFVPETVSVPVDRPFRLVVERREDGACSDQIAVPQVGILADLAPNGVTAVEFPPMGSGAYTLTCGMGMMSGRILAGDAAAEVTGTPIVGIALGALLVGIFGYAASRKTRPRDGAALG